MKQRLFYTLLALMLLMGCLSTALAEGEPEFPGLWKVVTTSAEAAKESYWFFDGETGYGFVQQPDGSYDFDKAAYTLTGGQLHAPEMALSRQVERHGKLLFLIDPEEDQYTVLEAVTGSEPGQLPAIQDPALFGSWEIIASEDAEPVGTVYTLSAQQMEALMPDAQEPDTTEYLAFDGRIYIADTLDDELYSIAYRFVGEMLVFETEWASAIFQRCP